MTSNFLEQKSEPLDLGSVNAIVREGRSHELLRTLPAAAALAESEERYRTLFASAPMAIFVCDRNAVIQDYNDHAAELWGREPVRGVEQHCGSVKLWLPDGTLLPHAQSPIGEVLRTGSPARNVEVFIERPDGSRLPVMVSFAPLKNTRGEVTGGIVSFVDITERKRAEKARRDIEEQFHVLADNIPALCWMAHADGWIYWYSRHWYEYTGTKPESQEGWGWESVHDPKELPAVMERWKASIASGQPFEMVFPLKGADGAFRPFLTRIVPHRDGEGRIVSWFGTNTDISGEREAATQVRESEQKLQDLIDALPVAVYTTDAHGRITFYNQAAAELAGREPKIGGGAWCVASTLYWPDGRPMPLDEYPVAVALKQGRPLHGEEGIAERPDGSRVPFLAYPKPMRDESGALTGAFNTLVDITERKHAERVSQRLVSIIECSQDAIVSTDLKGIVTSWNRGAEELFGYTGREILGKPSAILLPSDRLDEERGIAELIKRGEHIDPYETIRLRKDGSVVAVSLTVSPLENAEGRIVGASKIARDITAHKRAEEQQKLLLREMNHRIKNLFAVAAGLVSLSARSAGTPAEMAAAVRDRLAALARAHDLTCRDDPDAKATLNRDPTALDALIQTVFSPYLDPGSPSDQGRLIATGPRVFIGASAVTSFALILHEFATNAAKYGALTAPTGSIRIDWTTDQDCLQLVWREYGGPPVTGPPEKEGFGSILARRTITATFAGKVEYDWEPRGVTTRLWIPLDQLGAEQIET